MLCLEVLLVTLAVIHDVVASAQYGECSRGRTDFVPGILQGLYSGINATECELADNTQFKQYDPSNGEIFDFVVVGAGAAGSLLANKLSANPNWRVLLLEAGGDPTMTTEIPGLAFFSQRTGLDWGYVTEPENGIYWGYPKGGSVYWPRGKGMGGSTLLNAMFYTRGNPEDYNAWMEAGNKGWSYNDLLPHFRQIENVKASEILKCDSCMKYHGTGGELSVETFLDQLDPQSQAMADGLKAIGFGVYPDCNNPEMLKKGGFYFIQGTKKNGRRCNSAKAFIKPVENRANLRVSKFSQATKILIDKNKAAYGVQFRNRFDQNVKVFASKETIVSTGAVNTPQLMMLSGIGPQKHLQALGINVEKHMKFVGANLQDHPAFPGLIITVDKQFPVTDKSLLDQLAEYFARSSGFLSTEGTLLASNAAFIDSGLSEDGYPDVELIYFRINRNDPGTVGQSFGAYTSDIQKLMIDANKNRFMFSIWLVLLRPKSRGRIFLKSKNPEDHPKIYTGYFRNSEDFRPLIAAIRKLEKMVASKTMQDMGAKLELLDYPRCRQFQAGSDDYWACAIRSLVSTTFHPCCTMKMGPDSDPKAVVDDQLKVKGFSKLRAVDLSVAPSLVSAHTQAAAYVISHKAADMIIAEHSSDPTVDNRRT